MEELLMQYLQTLPTVALFAIIAAMLWTLGKGADVLVEEAVSLSIKWGIPKAIIGATVVSLGTTLPEVTVSVFAAIGGNPDLALGNAIGSIIVDTGLILGAAAILGNLRVDSNIVKRQGLIQIGAALLLTFACLPIFTGTGKGLLPQWVGWLFLLLLGIYLYMSMKWAKEDGTDTTEELHEEASPVLVQLFKLFFGITLVIMSSKVLIPAVSISAVRIGIPESIIAATLVAFGTSLPELITSITAVKKGHGELAVGNVVGADILNVLFVIGASVAVTPSGLDVPATFYKLQFPSMIAILCLFRWLSTRKGHTITRKMGFVLVGIYMVYLVLNFTWAMG